VSELHDAGSSKSINVRLRIYIITAAMLRHLEFIDLHVPSNEFGPSAQSCFEYVMALVLIR
jgi:hypothetical protein